MTKPTWDGFKRESVGFLKMVVATIFAAGVLWTRLNNDIHTNAIHIHELNTKVETMATKEYVDMKLDPIREDVGEIKETTDKILWELVGKGRIK